MPEPASFRLTRDPRQRESLVEVVRAVLQSFGHDVPWEELAAVLGIAALFTAVPHEACPRHWPAHGRDAFLVEGARLFGLDVRELHPPDAVPLPVTPPEYELHFRDSYLPLIRTALAHKQPVVGWRGWPEPADDAWGLITGIDSREPVCLGLAIGLDDRPYRLVRAPLQVYVVQGGAGRQASRAERVAAAVDHSLGNLRGEASDPQTATGAAALAFWRERILATPFCTRCAPQDWRCFQSLAAALAFNRSAGADFFREAGRYDLASAFDESARLVAPWTEETAARSAVAAAQSRLQAAEALDRLAAHDRRLIALLESGGR